MREGGMKNLALARLVGLPVTRRKPEVLHVRVFFQSVKHQIPWITLERR
jgi:hypothetical protein